MHCSVGVVVLKKHTICYFLFQEEVEAKREMTGNYNAMQLLLDNLKRRENWPEEFIRALEESEHPVLAQEMREAYEALKSTGSKYTNTDTHTHPHTHKFEKPCAQKCKYIYTHTDTNTLTNINSENRGKYAMYAELHCIISFRPSISAPLFIMANIYNLKIFVSHYNFTLYIPLYEFTID